MPEDNKHSVYDFEFITQALGLIPYQAFNLDDATIFRGAFNVGAIVNLEFIRDDKVTITLHGGEEILMSCDHLAELERALKQRAEDAKAIQKEAIRNQMMAQAEAAVEVQNKLNSGVQPGMIVGAPTGKRFRQ